MSAANTDPKTETEKDAEKASEQQSQPSKIPGVVEVPLMRVHGLGHGPSIVSGRGHGPRVMPGTLGPAYNGHGGVKLDIRDAKGEKLEPAWGSALEAHAPADSKLKDKSKE